MNQSSVLHSQPKSTVGTPAYIAPEVLLKKEYDGKVSDTVKATFFFFYVSHDLGHIIRRAWRLRLFAQMADVWSCGVTLYVMLVGAYPFEDPEEPKNFRKTIQVISNYTVVFWQLPICKYKYLTGVIEFFLQRILNVQYSIPAYVHISTGCRHLISRIFVAEPSKVLFHLFVCLRQKKKVQFFFYLINISHKSQSHLF